MHPPDEDDAATVSSMRAGARRALPLAVAVGGFGVSFGVLAGTAGLSPAAAIAMSLTTFAGSAQFAAVSVLGDGGAMAGAVLAAVLLNARYLPIGASVAPAMTGSPLRRFLEAQLVVDESWAIGHLGEGRFDRGRILGAGLVLYAAWTLGTVAGALGGDRLGDPETLGLDAAFPALFLALLAGQITGRRALAAALLGAVIALVLIPVAPPGVPVIAAALGCLLGLRQRTLAATEEAR
jgi:4-azaleucine resistance transporter AzlC